MLRDRGHSLDTPLILIGFGADGENDHQIVVLPVECTPGTPAAPWPQLAKATTATPNTAAVWRTKATPQSTQLLDRMRHGCAFILCHRPVLVDCFRHEQYNHDGMITCLLSLSTGNLRQDRPMMGENGGQRIAPSSREAEKTLDRDFSIIYLGCMTNQNTRQHEHETGPREGRDSGTRALLIDAGYRVLSEKGFEAATVTEIARVAGVSPGLFHYYFASKNELLHAVLEQAAETFGEAMHQLRTDRRGAELAEAAIEQVEERVEREPARVRLRYELFALGLRNPEFLSPVADLLASGRHGIARTLQVVGTPGLEEATVEALAALLLACFD